MKIYEPIAISLFTVLVLAASFMVGKNVGYQEGIEARNTLQLGQQESGQPLNKLANSSSN